VIAHQETLEANKHSSLLGPFIHNCLKEAGLSPKHLDGISVSSGPGSYTGLRVGASIAKGLCFSLQIPLIAVDSLLSVARHAADKHNCDLVFPMIDARRMEVYTASFNAFGKRMSENIAQVLSEDQFDTFLSNNRRIVICGNGTPKAKPLFEHLGIICDEEIIHSSLHLLKPALSAFEKKDFADIYHFAPGYLKAPNITKRKKSMI
jgi:tRNA threonylcarbamoyladenosine biosynthesis protein TsaB